MKLVFTLLLFSLLSTGCSSSNDNNPVLEDDETVTPVPDPNGDDETPSGQDNPPAEASGSKINADNYADLVSTVEQVGFHTFTRDYNLRELTRPFTSYTNALFADDDRTTDTAILDDKRDCDIAGTTDTIVDVYLGSQIFDIQYDFDRCETAAGSVDGMASYNEELVNVGYITHEFDLEFADVDIQGERGDRVIQGVFDIVDNQQLNMTLNFDVTSYVINVPDSMFLKVSGSGEYTSNTFEEVMDPTGISADSTLNADLVLTTSTGDGSDELTVDVTTDLGFASTEFLDVGSPVTGSLIISADDNSQVVLSPASVAGMVNIDLTAADGAVTRDIRSWSDLATAE